MPWPFFLPNALPGDKLKKNGVTGKLILTVGGKLTKDPFCCCDPYVTPHCPECPTCDPEATWIGTATDDGGLAEIAGGGPWGMLNVFDDPALPCGDAPFSISGYTRTDEFEYCGVTLRVTIIGDVVCVDGEFFGSIKIMVEQKKAGLIEWCGIAQGGSQYGDPDWVSQPVTIVGGCEAECKDYIVRGSVNVLYSESTREELEEACDMAEDELLGCYNQGGLFFTADITLSFTQDDCPPP